MGYDEVWTPNLFVQNHLSEVVERDAGETLVTVRHDGVATWSQKVTGEFDCSPMSISPYPYDIHTCSFNITTDVEVTKVHLAGFGFSISSQPEGFALERVCNKSRCSPASVGIHEGETDMQHSAMSFAQPLVTYTFKITREPSYIITSYVMMAWLLVILSMMQFWIPEARPPPPPSLAAPLPPPSHLLGVPSRAARRAVIWTALASPSPPCSPRSC